MTELERARKHLGDVQCDLAFVRANGGSDWGISRSENDVLAALSWVWEEQCAQQRSEMAEFEKGVDGFMARKWIRLIDEPSKDFPRHAFA